MKATKEVDIYLIRKRNVRAIDVVQYDTGVQLVFTVKDFTIPSGTTAALYVQKPSGKFVFQEEGITISGNTITVNLENQAITEHGKIPYQVSLKDGSDEITTFTGLMMVEQSLKDAGATESKTVIRAFDEAVSAHVAEFQAKAEQIVQACIATIPDDYTAMSAKVNALANAVKGYLSGAVVFADDVSPVEHEPVVKVRGKNLINYEAFRTVRIFNGEATFSDGGVLEITATSQDCYTLHSPFPDEAKIPVHAGQQFVLSWESDASVYGEVYILPDGKPVDFGRALATDGQLVYTVTEGYEFITYRFGVRDVGKTLKYWNIQLEEGTTATGYAPYIDPPTVTVTRYGKNLQKNDSSTQTINGVTFTVNNDGSVTVNGKATADARFLIYKRVPIKGVAKCILSGAPSGASETTYFLQTVMAWGGIDHSFYDYGKGREFDVGGTITASTVSITVKTGVTVSGLVFRPMIRLASISDGSFEPYTEQAALPAADGTVSGLTSLSPSMTILTDTEGVIVECEYNRDTNKVIDKLIKAITALGGTV